MINYKVILQSQKVSLFLKQEGLEPTERMVKSIYLSTRRLGFDVLFPIIRGSLWGVDLRQWSAYKNKKDKERRGRKINGML